jgi:hypothetical protein
MARVRAAVVGAGRSLLGLAAGLVALALAVAPARTAPPRVTVIGDSVQEALRFASQARAILGRGIDLRLEAAACRRLVAGGCVGDLPG